MIYVVGGGGGNSLNFNVVNGWDSPPSNPKENTIWVNTGVVITSWVFSATQPANPAQGMVWFSTGASSPVAFNALKKNSIMVYPMSARIYNNGEWSEKEAKIYQNGAWVEWAPEPFYIFKSGKGALVPLVKYSSGGISISIETDSIVHKITGGNQAAIMATEAAVDLDGFTTLNALVNCTAANNSDADRPTLGLFSSAVTKWEDSRDKSRYIAAAYITANSKDTVYSVPIPSGLETAYVVYGGGSTANIYDIWLE